MPGGTATDAIQERKANSTQLLKNSVEVEATQSYTVYLSLQLRYPHLMHGVTGGWRSEVREVTPVDTSDPETGTLALLSVY